LTEHRRELRDAAAADLADGVRKGDHRAIAEALTRVEDVRPGALAIQRELLAELERDTPREHTVVGLTGPPGAGKSSLASALIARLCARGEGVGMTAIDPSSQRSGGALLGDRARVHVPEGARVFIRSMAARDRLGGLAPATRAAVVVLRAAFPWVLVETVGVGQSEIDVASVADSIVLVVQPGSGDTLQFMKAGVLEIPDLLVVHKWDLGLLAEQALADLRAFLGLRARPAGWNPPLLGVSSHTGHGLAELEAGLREHRAYLAASGELDARRERARVAWALELFAGRYGGLGLERLGGRDAARELVRAESDTALDAFIRLATRAGLEPEPRPT
jgi:LAO/AO transport system kinase